MSNKRSVVSTGVTPKPKRMRKVIPLEVKLKVIRRLEGGERTAHICRNLDLNESTVRCIRDNKEKIKNRVSEGSSGLKNRNQNGEGIQLPLQEDDIKPCLSFICTEDEFRSSMRMDTCNNGVNKNDQLSVQLLNVNNEVEDPNRSHFSSSTVIPSHYQFRQDELNNKTANENKLQNVSSYNSAHLRQEDDHMSFRKVQKRASHFIDDNEIYIKNEDIDDGSEHHTQSGSQLDCHHSKVKNKLGPYCDKYGITGDRINSMDLPRVDDVPLGLFYELLKFLKLKLSLNLRERQNKLFEIFKMISTERVILSRDDFDRRLKKNFNLTSGRRIFNRRDSKNLDKCFKDFDDKIFQDDSQQDLRRQIVVLKKQLLDLKKISAPSGNSSVDQVLELREKLVKMEHENLVDKKMIASLQTQIAMGRCNKKGCDSLQTVSDLIDEKFKNRRENDSQRNTQLEEKTKLVQVQKKRVQRCRKQTKRWGGNN